MVAIDGPAGAGKSTAARRVAEELGFGLVDTGALYRGVALAAQEAGIGWGDEAALARLAPTLDITLRYDADGASKVWLDGVDRSADIRTAAISQGASDVSRFRGVRHALLGLQRRLGAQGGVVLEGRDIGTVVFPDAEVKVFLTASSAERAKRRCAELQARGQQAKIDEVLAAINQRDAQDSQREEAPLRAADDAFVLDTTDLELDAVVYNLCELVRRVGNRG